VFAGPAEIGAEGGDAEHAASSACSFFLLRPPGFAGLPLSETGVQRRATGADLVIVLVVRDMRLPLLRRFGSVDYRNASASQSTPS
jgi:hypothetical protein